MSRATGSSSASNTQRGSGAGASAAGTTALFALTGGQPIKAYALFSRPPTPVLEAPVAPRKGVAPRPAARPRHSVFAADADVAALRVDLHVGGPGAFLVGQARARPVVLPDRLLAEAGRDVARHDADPAGGRAADVHEAHRRRRVRAGRDPGQVRRRDAGRAREVERGGEDDAGVDRTAARIDRVIGLAAIRT